MPARQETFHLVPTTLVNATVPRRPMTSKAAKKAYRESTKLPKISRAEQRRLEAEEIAQQKKEYERERAAVKAKAAREKKLVKEKEGRDKRKKLGLPEPSRFVRASQPTIKLFVKNGAGGKRSWEDMNESLIEDAAVGSDESKDREPTPLIQQLPKTNEDESVVDDDEFGDFPALSQLDLPYMCEIKHNSQKRDDSLRTSQTSRTKSYQSPSRPSCHLPPAMLLQRPQLQSLTEPNNLRKPHDGMTKRKLSQELKEVPGRTPPVSCNLRSTATKALPGNSNGKVNMSEAVSSPAAAESVKSLSCSGMKGPGDLERAKFHAQETMPPPPRPTKAKGLGPRKALSEITGNMPPQSIPLKSKLSVAETMTMLQDSKIRQEEFMPPPSTALAFLTTNFDEFFPSPSQQVRELLEDIDDAPSNMQVAREIHTEPKAETLQVPATQHQSDTEDLGMDGFSSQDFEISSQDLRDIDTPSKPPSKGPPRLSISVRITNQTIPLKPPPAPRIKPRFFEEKEDDLLYAALHESSIIAKESVQNTNPVRVLTPAVQEQSSKSDSGDDDYGFAGSQIDPEFLAVLDAAEGRLANVSG